MFFLPEFVVGIYCWLHSCLAGSPLSGANFTVLISVSESLNKANCLIDVSSDGQVADRDMAEDSLVINDVGSAESNTIVVTLFNKAAIVFGDLLCQVGKHWHGHWAKTSLLAVLLGVFQMSEV